MAGLWIWRYFHLTAQVPGVLRLHQNCGQKHHVLLSTWSTLINTLLYKQMSTNQEKNYPVDIAVNVNQLHVNKFTWQTLYAEPLFTEVKSSKNLFSKPVRAQKLKKKKIFQRRTWPSILQRGQQTCSFTISSQPLRLSIAIYREDLTGKVYMVS